MNGATMDNAESMFRSVAAAVGVADDPGGGERHHDGNRALYLGGNVERREHRLRDPHEDDGKGTGDTAGCDGFRGGAELAALSGC